MTRLLLPLAVAVSLLAPALGAQPGELTFTNQAAALGAEQYTYGRGAAMLDLDGDGLRDLIAANDSQNNVFLRQASDGTFDVANGVWGLQQDTRPTWAVVAADLDGDGDPDVYFANGGFIEVSSNQLLRNDLDGAGVLADVSAGAGAAAQARQTFGASAVDYDLDGDLDLFCSNMDGGGCSLLRNDGGLVFADVSDAAGVDEPGEEGLRHCGAGDVDDDGWFEFGVGNALGDNVLFHNQGDGTFVDIAASAGVTSPERNFGFVFHDVDNDGLMDVYLPKLYLNLTSDLHPVFLNDGDLTFTEITDALGMEAIGNMGHNMGDLDADGFPEAYIGTGSPDIVSLDVLYSITPGPAGRMQAEDVSAASGIVAEGVTRCHGMAFGDLEGDGDVDLYQSNGGPTTVPDSLEENFLWINDGNDRAWLALVPRGVLSNRSAVGLRGVAFTNDGEQIHRSLQAGKGFGNTHAPELHFGLDDAESVWRVDLRWPSGIIQTVLQPALGTRASVVETGLRVSGDITQGGTVDVDLVGEEGFLADLLLSPFPAQTPLPKLGGILGLAPPLVPLLSVTLPPGGVLPIGFDIPVDPLLDGLTVHCQAWVRSPTDRDASTLTNVVTLSF